MIHLYVGANGSFCPLHELRFKLGVSRDNDTCFFFASVGVVNHFTTGLYGRVISTCGRLGGWTCQECRIATGVTFTMLSSGLYGFGAISGCTGFFGMMMMMAPLLCLVGLASLFLYRTPCMCVCVWKARFWRNPFFSYVDGGIRMWGRLGYLDIHVLSLFL